MSNPQETVTQRGTRKEEQSIDIKALIYIFLSRWYLFLISVIIAVGLGWLYNHFKTPQYQVAGTVLIKDQKSRLDPTSIMTGVYYGNYQNLDNELAILKSYTLCERVVKKMQLEVTYFDNTGFKAVELYKSAPFYIEFDKEIPQAVDLVYNIVFNNDETVSLKAESDHFTQFDYANEQLVVQRKEEEIKISGDFPIDDWIDTGYNRFRIVKDPLFNPDKDYGRKMSFFFSDYLTLVNRMNFSASPISKQASIVSISMVGPNRRKMVEFINTLMTEYVNRGLETKNKVSENTIEFIDQQLELTEKSLDRAEIELQDFRASHDLTNLNAQSQQVINTLQKLEQDHATMLVNMQYYKRLQSYMIANIDNPENLAAPSAMGINDPLLNKLVQDLVNLNQTRATQLMTMTEQHPTIVKIDEQIVTTKRTLLENINNLVENAQYNLNDIERRIRKIEYEAKNLPEKERLLVGYQRKFTLSQETYNYLMQRRAEAQIIKASNTADNEIIDPASVQRALRVAPRNMKNYLIALIIGLLIPAIILFLKDFFNVKVQSKKDIENVTNFPIIGQIGQVSGNNPLVVIDNPKSPIAEAFRSIRTNIDFITQGKEKSTILVTGDMQSVGKTFNSINIASIYALYGKKTLLLGFDLRKPKLFQEFGLSNSIGLSSYLSNKNTLDEVIQSSGKIDSLDIITSGPIPPNPAELIASKRTDELFQEIRERYDYIVIDTPPLGLVTDAFLLMKHSDANIYIVRQGTTDKNIFESIIKDIESRGLKVNIVVNGIHQEGGYGYGKYNYGYGYGYGYGYAYGYGYGRHGRYGEENEGYYSDDESSKGKKKKRRHHHSS